MKNGLYIVLNIAKGYEEKALSGIEVDNVIANAYSSIFIIPEDTNNESNDKTTSKINKARYFKYYYRFAYLGLEKIRNLYKVIILRKKIKVPRDFNICKVCVLMKLRNKISKQLSA